MAPTIRTRKAGILGAGEMRVAGSLRYLGHLGPYVEATRGGRTHDVFRVLERLRVKRGRTTDGSHNSSSSLRNHALSLAAFRDFRMH